MADEYEDQQYDEEEQPRRRLGSLIALLVAIVIIIIVILLLRGCGERASGESSEKGAKTIEAVEGYTPVEGAVSVWIKEGSSIDDIVSIADVDLSNYVDMGGGRYILDVAPGTEEAAVKTLSKMKGCYDAGRVYEMPK